MLPDLPDGEYCIVIYDLRTESRNPFMTEQFTLAHSSGTWALVNYYLGAKPFHDY